MKKVTLRTKCWNNAAAFTPNLEVVHEYKTSMIMQINAFIGKTARLTTNNRKLLTFTSLCRIKLCKNQI